MTHDSSWLIPESFAHQEAWRTSSSSKSQTTTSPSPGTSGQHKIILPKVGSSSGEEANTCGRFWKAAQGICSGAIALRQCASLSLWSYRIHPSSSTHSSSREPSSSLIRSARRWSNSSKLASDAGSRCSPIDLALLKLASCREHERRYE